MNDLYIFSYNHEFTEGLFGQLFPQLLELLNFLTINKHINNNTKIAFNLNAQAYDNVVPTHIVPNNIFTIEQLNNPIKINLRQFKLQNSKQLDFKFNEQSYLQANNIFNQWFHFSDSIIHKIPTIPKLHTYILGIHYRGTDKNIDNIQSNNMDIHNFIKIIYDFLSKNTYYQTIVLCSDSKNAIDLITSHFNTYTIILYQQDRIDENIDHQNLALFQKAKLLDQTTKFNMIESCIIDMLLLTKAHTIIKTSSALSCFSKIINPNIKIYTTSAMKQPFFPCGVVEKYKTNDSYINQILDITMKGHLYNI